VMSAVMSTVMSAVMSSVMSAVMSAVMSSVMSAPRKKMFCSYLLLFFFVNVLFMLFVLIYWCPTRFHIQSYSCRLKCLKQ
jgi:hypothetical protein